MLLSEIVYNIKNLIAGGIESDDENLSDLQVAFIIGYYRAKLVKQDKEKGRFNKDTLIQNLGRVPLIRADKNECCDIEDCILRTQFKIPTPMEIPGTLNLTFVGNTDGTPYQMKTHNSAFWSKHSKYDKSTKWYYQNGYLYIMNPPSLLLDAINIQGIFSDPSIAESFRTCDCDNNTTCLDTEELDFEYPMPVHYVDLIVKMVAETELRILNAMPSDISNDSLDQVNQVVNG